MTQTLMAEFEDDNVFPATESVLFLGGPKHGQSLEVVSKDPTHKVFAPPAPPMIAPDVPMPMLSGAGMQVHTYVRRELGFQDETTGARYVRVVYIHEGVPNPQVGQQLLMAALLEQFVKAGQKVIDHDEPNRGSTSGG